MKRHSRVAILLRNKRGFTLVELLVSAAVITIAIVAVAAVARKSREIDITYLHHRRARAVIDSCFESQSYQYANYANLSAVTSQSVLVDPRAGTALNGSLSITVTSQSLTQGTNTINYKDLAATVTWTEPEGQQSITLHKWVTQL